MRALLRRHWLAVALVVGYVVWRFFPRVRTVVHNVVGVVTAGDPTITYHASGDDTPPEDAGPVQVEP